MNTNELSTDWKADIAATDKNEIHMIHFADILTEGIVKQFPGKFFSERDRRCEGYKLSITA